VLKKDEKFSGTVEVNAKIAKQDKGKKIVQKMKIKRKPGEKLPEEDEERPLQECDSIAEGPNSVPQRDYKNNAAKSPDEDVKQPSQEPNSSQAKPLVEEKPEKIKTRKPKIQPKEASPEKEVITLKKHHFEKKPEIEQVS